MNKLFLPMALIALVLTSVSFSVYAAGEIVEVTSGAMQVDGYMRSSRAIRLTVGRTFGGEGRLEAPSIYIIAKRFDFRGEIICSDRCTIWVQEELDPVELMDRWRGVFKVIHAPTLAVVTPQLAIRPARD